jgi:mannose-6-phosphate isomerase-like protein (cupin superfamily)
MLGGVATVDAQAPAGGRGQAPAGPAIRRVVTGHNAAGKSCVISDEMITGPLWSTTGAEPLGAKAAGEPSEILANSGLVGDPPVGGTRWMIATFQPAKDPKPSLENRIQFHRTATLDYAYVLSGEVTLLLDVQEVLLKTGDVVVQRNTYHSWRVDASVPVRLLMLMMRV